MKSWIAFITIFSIMTFAGCNTTSEIELKVVSSGGTFSGYYIADNDETVSFSNTSYTNNQGTYEAKICLTDKITVEATAATPATAIAIRIYQDGILVQEQRDTGDGTTSITSYTSYTYSDDPEPYSSSSSSDSTTTTTTTTSE